MVKLGRPPIVDRLEKYCSRCEQTKLISEFYIYKSGKTGGYCKDCEKNYKRERNAIRASIVFKTPEQIAEEKRIFQEADAERIRRYVEGNQGFKICNTCKEEKPNEAFYKSTIARDGLQGKCIACSQKYVQDNAEYIAIRATNYERENKEKIDTAYQIRKAADPEKHRIAVTDRTLKYMYGISLAERDAMLEAQNGGCAICGALEVDSERRFAVDHCHLTGAVRGILCTTCNTGIGGLKDSIELLKQAISYLERY